MPINSSKKTQIILKILLFIELLMFIDRGADYFKYLRTFFCELPTFKNENGFVEIWFRVKTIFIDILPI